MNNVTIMGHLGIDTILRYTQAGTAVCNLRVATNERFKRSSGETGERTEWHNVVVFGKTAENCAASLSKGSKVLLAGRLQTRKWQDKEGLDRYTTEVVASSVTFLDPRSAADDVPAGRQDVDDALDSEDIPF